MDTPSRPRRRRFSRDFKAQVLEACERPGASMADIARSHGLSTDRIRRWLRAQAVRQVACASDQQTGFVPVRVSAATTALSTDTPMPVRIEVRRGDTLIKIDWPAAFATQLGPCLKDWLQ